jgi:hypothetical protein
MGFRFLVVAGSSALTIALLCCVGEDPAIIVVPSNDAESGEQDGSEDRVVAKDGGGDAGCVPDPDPGCPTCTTVASCLDEPRGLALSPDRKTLYFTTFDKKIWRLDLTNAAAAPEPFTLPAETKPSEIVADDTWIFAANRNAIWRTQLDGGGAILFHPDPSASGITLDGTNVYWPRAIDPRVHTCPKTGCDGGSTQVVVSATIGTEVGGISSRGGALAWVVVKERGRLGICTTTATCSTSRLYTPPGSLHEGRRVFLHTNGRAYWTTGDNSGGELFVSEGDAGTTKITDVKGAADGVFVDGSYVYWTVRAENAALLEDANKIMRTTLAPDGGVTTLAKGKDPAQIVVTDSTIYWSNRGNTDKSNGSLVRMPKPQ